jgi:hypothetical protein
MKQHPKHLKRERKGQPFPGARSSTVLLLVYENVSPSAFLLDNNTTRLVSCIYMYIYNFLRFFIFTDLVVLYY